ncbi:hypothetical protein FMN50_06910 [Rhodobacterales bacterium]|nr:hypothetical protein FMN50_06910 [Rhodobacterales bacterium]
MIPIVYVRFGKPQSHTYFSIEQTLRENENVHFIGEAGEVPFDSRLHFHSISNYMDSLSKIRDLYVPLSTSNPYFEYYCIARWFVLSEFASYYNIDKLYYCDDDVYNFCNISDVSEIYKDYIAAFCVTSVASEMAAISACCSFWSREALVEFCSFIIAEYENNIERYIERWRYCFRNEIRGGVSDMTFLYHFCSNRSIGNLNKITEHGCFDSNPLSKGIWLTDEYKMEKPKNLGNREIKSLIFRDNKAFAYNFVRNQEVRIFAAPEHAKFDVLRERHRNRLRRKLLSAFKFSFKNI